MSDFQSEFSGSLSPEHPKSIKRRKSKFLTEGNRVGILPQKGWARRNYHYLSESLLPAMVQPREERKVPYPPVFNRLEKRDIEIVWIGHASFLVRAWNFNILIDPVWAKWMGPVKRQSAPGLEIADLPSIDLVLITHAHFDHLCCATLKRITDGGQTVIVPKGVGKVVKKLNFRRVIEMSEWETVAFRDTQIHFTPAHHWGARYIHDNHRGFGGFVVDLPGHTLYHAGDSAYFEGFSKIGARYDIQTALLPIGAYESPSGREVHMNPEEALRAFVDLNAERMLPMHHATFPLGGEQRDEPLRRLREAVKRLGLNGRVLAPNEGEQLLLKSSIYPMSSESPTVHSLLQ